jgi:hypothetical protein
MDKCWNGLWSKFSDFTCSKRSLTFPVPTALADFFRLYASLIRDDQGAKEFIRVTQCDSRRLTHLHRHLGLESFSLPIMSSWGAFSLIFIEKMIQDEKTLSYDVTFTSREEISEYRQLFDNFGNYVTDLEGCCRVRQDLPFTYKSLSQVKSDARGFNEMLGKKIR